MRWVVAFLQRKMGVCRLTSYESLIDGLRNSQAWFGWMAKPPA